MTANGKGIDYGLGRTNVDHATGIRYGVISQHTISGDALNDLDSVYAGPNCPKCGADAEEIPSHTESSDPPGTWVSVIQDVPPDMEDFETARGQCPDYACRACRYLFDGTDAYGDESIGLESTDPDYTIESCLDSDLIVTRSPYYTRGVFCSPCVPGAVSLDSPDDDGARAYCLGHAWYETGRAPYPVYRVSDGARVEPDSD